MRLSGHLTSGMPFAARVHLHAASQKEAQLCAGLFSGTVHPHTTLSTAKVCRTETCDRYGRGVSG